MIKRRYKVDIPRLDVSCLRKGLNEEKELNSKVSSPLKSDKHSLRVIISVQGCVNDITGIELLEKTIKYNNGVIVNENHTGEFSNGTRIKEGIKKNFTAVFIYYIGLISSHVLLRINNTEIDFVNILYVLAVCIPVAMVTYHRRNFKFRN